VPCSQLTKESDEHLEGAERELEVRSRCRGRVCTRTLLEEQRALPLTSALARPPLQRLKKERSQLRSEVEHLSASLKQADTARELAAEAAAAKEGGAPAAAALNGHEKPHVGSDGRAFPEVPGAPHVPHPPPAALTDAGSGGGGGEDLPWPGRSAGADGAAWPGQGGSGAGAGGGSKAGGAVAAASRVKGGAAKAPAARKGRPFAPPLLTVDQSTYYLARVTTPAEAGAEVEAAPRSPKHARALLVIAYNRPEYLARTLSAVLARLPAYNRPHVYVSQDGEHEGVTQAIKAAQSDFSSLAPDVPFTHLKHPREDEAKGLRGEAVPGWAVGYYKLSAHFKWALTSLFEGKGHPRVIILEDDLEVAPDFFDYFSAVEPLLDADHTLLAASAWSDLGQSSLVSDPRQVHRSDFFPGLGWVMARHVWEELGPKWPVAFWDDWLREPAQRGGRHFLRPEVSRSFTFGATGVSSSQFFDEFLATIHLNAAPIEWSVEDLSYLALERWDEAFEASVAAARLETSLEAFISVTCGGVSASSSGLDLSGALVTAAAGVPIAPDAAFAYDGEEGYKAVARALHFIDDIKAGVPRTAYRGVTVLKHGGCAKFLYDSAGGVAPPYRPES
jgi:alpha-1,3-mannosyl-glycoprotein beta-1,2-N-acetylglucosaminyltransferase